MDVLSKIVTAIKGGINEAGEALINSQDLRILDQEIREAGEALNQSKDALAAMIAQQKLSEEKVGKLHAAIEENEGYTVKALAKGDEGLARDLAIKIAELETDLATEQDAGKSFTQSADRMRQAIAKAQSDLQYMKSQVDTIKATENVQRAEAAVSERHSGTSSKLRTAMESLERIKEKQAMASAQMNAAEALATDNDDASLHKRLIDAGIKDSNSAEDVLQRIKKKYT